MRSLKHLFLYLLVTVWINHIECSQLVLLWIAVSFILVCSVIAVRLQWGSKYKLVWRYFCKPLRLMLSDLWIFVWRCLLFALHTADSIAKRTNDSVSTQMQNNHSIRAKIHEPDWAEADDAFLTFELKMIAK